MEFSERTHPIIGPKVVLSKWSLHLEASLEFPAPDSVSLLIKPIVTCMQSSESSDGDSELMPSESRRMIEAPASLC